MKKKLVYLDARIAGDLRLRLEAGEWRPGEQLPGERELAESYGVQRTTIRKALAILVQRGALEARERSGHFSAVPPLAVDLRRLHDVGTFFCGAFRWEVRSKTRCTVSAEMERKLRIPAGTRAQVVKRRGVVDERVVCLEKRVLVGRSAHGGGAALGNHTADIVYASAKEAQAMRLQPLDALLLLRGHSYDGQGVLIDYHEILLDPDKLLFTGVVDYDKE